MTNRRRNLTIIGVLVVLLGLAALVITTKPTRLGLDLKGGIELVYEARPTPKSKVTPEAIQDALSTIRKRTDALGVAEPEIQTAGPNQISIGLPDVANADRAIEQVGTTAQLQFYDWEPNVVGRDGKVLGRDGASSPETDVQVPSLFDAVVRAGRVRPLAEPEDIPASGPSTAAKRAPGGANQYYDRQNDSAGEEKYYLFGPDRKLIAGPDASCKELLSDFESRAKRGARSENRQPAKGSACAKELRALGSAGPPAKSQVRKVPRGVVVVKGEREPPTICRRKPPCYYVIEDDSELSGADIVRPQQNSSNGEPVVSFQFTKSGAKEFERVTRRIAVRGSEQILPAGVDRDRALQTFAIALDDELVSRASIDFVKNPEGIDGRTGAEITGVGNLQRAQDLANNLRIGALPITLKQISQTQISATLGKQALNQGLRAAAAGLALTLLFLLLFYRVLGAVAAVALLTYAVLLFMLVKLIPVTLTLPGIAGLILTLGVAADANIVIFERIKEEARSGRAIHAAIATGYAKAFHTIRDANTVTLLVAFVLFMLATAGIKGFALTLGVGTLVSLFTAVLATSAILGTMSRSALLRSKQALGAGKEHIRWAFDFTGSSRFFFSMSGVILVAGALAIAGLGIQLGIDFESGTRIKSPLERSASVAQVREALAPSGHGDARIQQLNEPTLGRNVFQISIGSLQPDDVTKVRDTLDERFGVRQADFSSTSIGPTFGAQIAKTALIAVIASLLLISGYIAWRFQAKFAIPVLIALAHDLLITAGIYALTGREVTTSTVAALLTILGYSLYDTIIVFDRIRENVPRMPRATFSQVVNRSMSEVLTRSLATSFSTLLPIAALMLFGGETLKDFGFALLVGVASGTYSSIFIAAPVLTAWKEREPVYVRRRQVVIEEHGYVPPYADEDLAGDEVAVRERARRARAEARNAERAAAARQGAPAGDAAGRRGARASEPAYAEPPSRGRAGAAAAGPPVGSVGARAGGAPVPDPGAVGAPARLPGHSDELGPAVPGADGGAASPGESQRQKGKRRKKRHGR